MSSTDLVLEGSSSSILPTTGSSLDWVSRSDPRYRVLAGNGDALKGCGVWMWRGCLEYDKHFFMLKEGQTTLSGDVARRIGVAEAYKASCGRLACPVCYEKACAKLALKIEHRMKQFSIKGRKLKAIHVVVSPNDYDVLGSFPELRRKAYNMALECGMLGGCIIFHPFRLYNEDDASESLKEGFSHKTAPASWYVAPHFHVLGYGWIHGTKENYEKTGWIVKNVGVRKSIRATAHYQLSHCGVNDRFHTVVWFGALSYKKLKCRPFPEESHPCPICKKEFRPLEWLNVGLQTIVESNLTDEGIFYVEEGLFRYKTSRGDGG